MGSRNLLIYWMAGWYGWLFAGRFGGEVLILSVQVCLHQVGLEAWLEFIFFLVSLGMLSVFVVELFYKGRRIFLFSPFYLA